MKATYGRSVSSRQNRVRRSIIALIILSAGFAVSVSAQTSGYLHADGPRIVNANGQEVLLSGMGLGGWMVPEGYMLQTSSFANAAWEIRQKISSLIGATNTDEFFRRYRSNYVKKKDIDSLAAWGFNSVRLPMHYALLTPEDQPGVYLESGFAMIDSLLDWCGSNGMYLILDLHAAPGGQSDQNISDYDPSKPSLWESETNRTRTIDLWKTLAQRYATEPWIGGYDVLNEPRWDLGPQNVPLRDLYVAITQAIRTADTNHIIYIEGNQYATDFTGLTPPWDDNMVYSFHKYWNDNSAGSISGYLSLRTNHNVPLWLGETGENSNSWFTECVQLLKANNIGWAWWPHKKFGTISAPWSVPITPGYDRVLKYWRGEAAHPGTAEATAALLGMADRLDLDSCEYHPDIADALFRQVTSDVMLPFRHGSIPGRIYAVDYDLGRHNIAYKDNDYQNVGGGIGNRGYQYRNEGVDIDVCADTATNGYSVGWIESGEYLNFTVRVARTDTYKVSVRIAANVSGGSILMKVDGQPLGSFFPVPPTGGWQNWRTIEPGTAVLTEGTHTLNLVFAFGGFNVNYVEFTSLSTGGTDPGDIPETFELSQNYPNPFNPGTQITYSLPTTNDVSLKVFDMLGREVAVLVDEKVSAGVHTASWIATGLPSGVYVCRLAAGGFTHMRKMVLVR